MVLIFGGTTEGRIAAQTLDAAGTPFYYSTKGELQEVMLHNGKRVCGAMDAGAMEQFCRENDIRVVVDAAHPFAEGLHGTIDAVTARLGLEVLRYERDFNLLAGKRNGISVGAPEGEIILCGSYEEAVERLQQDGIVNLLALTGVNTIPKLKEYWSKGGNICHFRVLDRDESRGLVAKAGFPMERILYFSEPEGDGDKSAQVLANESSLMKGLAPQAIITKESGASGYFKEKVQAAMECGIKVYAVRRPKLPERFITVYGPVGLRMEVERLVPDFFPLRIGLTTGSTATAATKAALRRLLYGESPESVHIVLPQGEPVRMKIKATGGDGEQAWGCAEKFSGDDPDITGGKEIFATLCLNWEGSVQFFGGDGVGTVTLPGLGLEVGGPAINNGPRKMMEMVVAQEKELYNEYCFANGIAQKGNWGVDITISVPGGKELALRTFNPKVGVEGGISIIGTSGVVRPFSKEAFLESISREMDVAKALGVQHLVINSGAKSQIKLKEKVGEDLPGQAFVHYGNFIGETVRMAAEHGFPKVTLGIMIGKAVKLAAGNLDTHSKVVTVDKEFVKWVAQKYGCTFIPDNFTLARELWGMFKGEDAQRFFGGIVELCHSHCAPLIPDGKLEVVLVEE